MTISANYGILRIVERAMFFNLLSQNGGVIMLKQQTIEEALNSSDERIKCVGIGSCRLNSNLSREFVNELRTSPDPGKRQAAMLACFSGNMPLEWALEGLDDCDHLVKHAAVNALQYHGDMPVEQIEGLLYSELWYRKHAGVNACISKDLSLNILREWAWFDATRNMPKVFCDAAAAACIDNPNIKYKTVERIMCKADTVNAKRLAARAFRGRNVPVARIVYLLHSASESAQMAGLYAYSVDMPIPYVEIGEKLISENVYVRRLAAAVCDKSRQKVVRVVEPMGQVYKRCAGGVIVVATIPADAQIRGNSSQGYRASKAVIEDVVGTFCGEPVGVSLHDHVTSYCIGDEIEISDYDFSYEPMSTGFHFFTEYERAKEF